MFAQLWGGEREPAKLAELRHPGCKHTEAEIIKALTGTWQEAQIFILEQNLQLYDFYTAQLSACDREMERYYQAMVSRHEKDAPLPDLPRAKPCAHRSVVCPDRGMRARHRVRGLAKRLIGTTMHLHRP